MSCRDNIYGENSLDYMVNSYRGESYVQYIYEPSCTVPLDSVQMNIYKEVERVTPEAIEQFGFSSIPNLYGLMSEEALEDSGVLQVRRTPYLDLYGQGVLVGIVDTGIDYTHEAFIETDNTSRITALWDQTQRDGEGSERFPYGAIYTKAQLDEALASDNPRERVPTVDENGHGTFLAGIMAGKENREQGFSGVAPLSTLVVVKCKEAKQSYRDYYGVLDGVPAYQENDILAGISFILQTAWEQQKPVVICFGMGSNMGSHDGGSYLSQYMERYTTADGVSILTCIGNEGNSAHHHKIQRKEDTINLNVEKSLNGFMAQLWWRTPGALSLSLISPSGETYSDIAAETGQRRRLLFRAENTTVELFFATSSQLTRERVVSMRFLSPKTGIWKIIVQTDYENPGYHMWLPISEFLSQEVVFLNPDPDNTLSSVGTGEYTIMVSAYNVREQSLYLSAGRGYTPVGHIKPEIVAPGVNIRSTLPGNCYGTVTGTGVAAAFATGVAALFMQYYEEQGTIANGIDIRETFIEGCIPKGNGFPNTEWGFGILNAYDSLT